ncbi:unnamed protein product [Brachionus calyciflorus]|uniref:MULE transposase domain-containing protein n=1 Tax=Brachionus calyciflorus TaxID=104777 RepID=A0A814C4U6_9BILA|nr:unnamed protein product [Brachionus calyciflorus]
MKIKISDKPNPNHDAHDLCLNGYLFKRQRINKNSINWLCKIPLCSGSVTLSKNNDKIERFVEHEHVRVRRKFGEVEQAAQKFKISCKIRCETEPNLSAGKIFLEEQTKIAQSSGVSYQDLTSVIPAFASIKPTLERRKKISRPKLPACVTELELPPEFTETFKGDKFLILNKSNKILVFCSLIGLQALGKTSHWYADGTFRSSARFYYQLYIIHAYINNHMLACCWAYMNRRREKEYDLALRAIKKEAKVHKIVLSPKFKMTDFELAAINSFKSNFEGIRNKGCLLHFTKCLMKKIQDLGLKPEYEKDDTLVYWFKSICALALIPLNSVDDQFENILAKMPNYANADKFLGYFVKTYFEGQYPVEMWNHFETEGTPRTNNNLQGYNNKLNRHISVSHPDIFKAISKLKEEEVDLCFKYYRAVNKERAPNRNKLYIINDAIMLNQKKMLIDKDITVEIFIKYAIMSFDLSKLNKKKTKSLQSLDDTLSSEYSEDDSDDEIDSDND